MLYFRLGNLTATGELTENARHRWTPSFVSFPLSHGPSPKKEKELKKNVIINNLPNKHNMRKVKKILLAEEITVM